MKSGKTLLADDVRNNTDGSEYIVISKVRDHCRG